MKCKVFLLWLISCMAVRICDAMNYTVKAGDPFECTTKLMFSKYDVSWTLTTANGTGIKIFTCDSQLRNYIDLSYNPENNFEGYCIWNGLYGYSGIKVKQLKSDMLNLTCLTDRDVVVQYCQLEFIVPTIQPNLPKPTDENDSGLTSSLLVPILIPVLLVACLLLILLLFCVRRYLRKKRRNRPVNRTTETMDISYTNTVFTVWNGSPSQERSDEGNLNQRSNANRLPFCLPKRRKKTKGNVNLHHTTSIKNYTPRHTPSLQGIPQCYTTSQSQFNETISHRTMFTVWDSANSPEDSDALSRGLQYQPSSTSSLTYVFPTRHDTSSGNVNLRHTTSLINYTPRHTTSQQEIPQSYVTALQDDTPSHRTSQQSVTPSHITSQQSVTPSHITSQQSVTPSHITSQQSVTRSHIASQQSVTPRHIASQQNVNQSHTVPRRNIFLFTIQEVSEVNQTHDTHELNTFSLDPPSYTSLYPTNPPPYHATHPRPQSDT